MAPLIGADAGAPSASARTKSMASEPVKPLVFGPTGSSPTGRWSTSRAARGQRRVGRRGDRQRRQARGDRRPGGPDRGRARAALRQDDDERRRREVAHLGDEVLRLVDADVAAPRRDEARPGDLQGVEGGAGADQRDAVEGARLPRRGEGARRGDAAIERRRLLADEAGDRHRVSP